jgi:hypothetical protein
MKTLVLTTRLFDRPRSGGELGTARLLDRLRAQAHELHVIGRGEAPAAGMGEGVRCTSLGPLVGAQATLATPARLRSLAAAGLRGRAWTVHRTLADGAARRARAVLDVQTLRDADLLVVDHLHPWAWLDALPHRARTAAPPALLVMHNVESAIYRPGPPVSSLLAHAVLAREARLLEQLERRALASAAAVACVSEADAQALRGAPWCCNAVIEVLKNHGPLGRALPAPPHAPGRRRVGLIGTWSWAATRRGLDWVLREVLPQLPPQVELVLAGTGLPPLAPHPQLRVLGPVRDIESFYGQIDLVAIAALDGSGVQEKAIEALARPHAVVATRHALRDLAPWPTGVVAADTAADFARACATLPLPGRSTEAACEWNLARAERYGSALQRAVTAAMRRPRGGLRQGTAE